MKGTSTLEEILKRGPIYKTFESTLKEGILIVMFKDGTQANVTHKVWESLKEIQPTLYIGE